jgi:glycopeptide antibiotics resistance protein
MRSGVWSWRLAAAAYLALLLPGLVLDLGGRMHPRAFLLEFRSASPGRLAADAVVNVLAFVPLGWLLGRAIVDGAASALSRMATVVGVCALLSLAVETLQYFLPSRYSSLIDVLANTTGALLGALVAERWRLG